MLHISDLGIVVKTNYILNNKKITKVLTKKHGAKVFFINSNSNISIGDIICSSWVEKRDGTVKNAKADVIFSSAVFTLGNLEASLIASTAVSELAIIFEGTQNCNNLFDDFEKTVKSKKQDRRKNLIKLENTLLSSSGYGLDINSCTVCKTRKNLTNVHSETGCAICGVCSKNIEKDKLLVRPRFFEDTENYNDILFLEVMDFMAFFLEKGPINERSKNMPESRMALRNEIYEKTIHGSNGLTKLEQDNKLQ